MIFGHPKWLPVAILKKNYKNFAQVILTMFKPTAGRLELDINSLLVNIYTYRYVGNEGIYIVFALWGLRRSRVHSLMIARRSLCPEKLGSNPGQGSRGINFSGWHGLDMSITVTKGYVHYCDKVTTPTNQTL